MPSLKTTNQPETSTPLEMVSGTVDHSTTYLMNDEFNIAIITVTLLLSLVAMSLNFGVMTFYRKTARSKIVSFIYFMLSVSDFCTGVCALLHTFIFAVMLGEKDKMTSHVSWLIVPAYFLTAVAFKTSAFVSATFAVVRTIYIVDPFRIVNKRVVVVMTAIYSFMWACIFAVDVAIIVYSHTPTRRLESVMSSFYYPSKSRLVLFLHKKYNYIMSGNLECLADCLYIIPPVFLCALLALIVTVVQIVCLWLPGKSAAQSATRAQDRQEKRRASITITLITTLFVICAGVTLYQPQQICANPLAIKDRRMYYATGYLPFFINAALNPTILLWRVSSLREFLLKRMCGANPLKSMRSTTGTSDTTDVVNPASPSVLQRKDIHIQILKSGGDSDVRSNKARSKEIQM